MFSHFVTDGRVDA